MYKNRFWAKQKHILIFSDDFYIKSNWSFFLVNLSYIQLKPYALFPYWAELNWTLHGDVEATFRINT